MHAYPASPEAHLAGQLSTGFRLRSSTFKQPSNVFDRRSRPVTDPQSEGPPIEERRCAPGPLAGSVGHRANYKARRGPVRDEQ